MRKLTDDEKREMINEYNKEREKSLDWINDYWKTVPEIENRGCKTKYKVKKKK